MQERKQTIPMMCVTALYDLRTLRYAAAKKIVWFLGGQNSMCGQYKFILVPPAGASEC